MPRGNGTGPMGMGQMTDRAAGFCAVYPTPGFANPMPGAGAYGGRGGGRGWRHKFHATGLTGWQRGAVPIGAYGQVSARVQALETLKSQAEYFENSLEGIKKRIEEIEVETEE